MLEFNAYSFYITTASLHTFEDKINKAIENRGQPSVLTKQEIEEARHLFDMLEDECVRVELGQVLQRLRGYRVRSIHPGLYNNMTLTELLRELVELYEALERGLSEKMFMYVPATQAGYYDRSDLFGAEVSTAFPTTVEDMQEAGNCYATGRHTACVMHLMRVLEVGLKRLAKRFRVPFQHANWGTVIGQIEAKIRDIERAPRKPRNWRRNRQFYAQAAKEFRYFKDAWRNYTMHAHTTYDEHQAL